MRSRNQAATLEELTTAFNELEDPRSAVNRRHPLVSVVSISVMGVLAGADGPTGIRKWAESKQSLLPDILDLPHGIPSRDVFRRVLCALHPEAFQSCFVSWIEALLGGKKEGEQRHVAIDGKCLKGSRDARHGLGPLHLVSAWASEQGLTLAQVPTEEKSNEITAIPELLRLIDLDGAVITIDAMGTQTAIAEQIVNGKGNYVLSLKKNQGLLYQAALEFVAEHVENDFADVAHERLVDQPQKPRHGRQETRTYIQFEVPNAFLGSQRWKGLKTIGLCVYEWSDGQKHSIETHYYLSSLPLHVGQFAKSVRSHWGIENTCHWSLDVTYREDQLRSRQRQETENMAWLRRFTLSLLKQHPAKSSLAMKRRSCGWNWDFLLEVIGFKTLSVR
ncbi:MAG: ISAs1 family transposase [Planctomycetaceae bacterium]